MADMLVKLYNIPYSHDIEENLFSFACYEATARNFFGPMAVRMPLLDGPQNPPSAFIKNVWTQL